MRSDFFDWNETFRLWDIRAAMDYGFSDRVGTVSGRGPFWTLMWNTLTAVALEAIRQEAAISAYRHGRADGYVQGRSDGQYGGLP